MRPLKVRGFEPLIDRRHGGRLSSRPSLLDNAFCLRSRAAELLKSLSSRRFFVNVPNLSGDETFC